jgi:hypothetical protein
VPLTWLAGREKQEFEVLVDFIGPWDAMDCTVEIRCERDGVCRQQADGVLRVAALHGLQVVQLAWEERLVLLEHRGHCCFCGGAREHAWVKHVPSGMVVEVRTREKYFWNRGKALQVLKSWVKATILCQANL